MAPLTNQLAILGLGYTAAQERTRRSLERPEHRPCRRARWEPSALHHGCAAVARPRQSGVTSSLDRRLNHCTTRERLVVDEIGYLSYDARAVDFLFQVVSRTYERRSLVLTTNLPFSESPTIFPNAATTALIEGLVHHAEILTIEGDSYWRRVAEATHALATGLGYVSRHWSTFHRSFMSRNSERFPQRHWGTFP